MKSFKLLSLWISLSIGLNAQAAEPECDVKAGDCSSGTPPTVHISGNSPHELAATTGVDTPATAAKPTSSRNAAFVVNAIGTRTRIAEAAVVQRDDRQFYVLSRDDWLAQRLPHVPDSVSPDVVSIGNLFLDQSLLQRASGSEGREGP